MTGVNVALDTSAAIRLLNDAALAARFLAHVRHVYISAVAAGELLYGASNSARRNENLPRFREFIAHCEPLPVSVATAELYAEIRLDLKKQGTPIPDADIWIAAGAIERSLPLTTTDQHFARVQKLSLYALDAT